MTSQELKNSILQYAVQGKLVPQNPNDEPASELLKKIKAEKEQLIKEKVIKKEKPSLPIKDEEKSYEIPDNWEWVRLDEIIIQNIGGGTPSKTVSKYWNGNIPWASVKDLNCDELLTTIDTISEEGLNNSSSNLIHSGNIIVCTRMGLGKIVINKIDVAINQDLRGLILSKFIQKNYFVNFYKTISLIGSGLTVKGIKVEDLNKTLFPLPPLAEQQRIVEKIEELMPLVEQYGKAEAELKELNKAFPEKIKKSVLQYAIQGKLVPQNPQNEPASVLLEKIKAEKQKLIRDKKIKADKPLPAIAEEEKPFEIPDSWVWVRLGEIVHNFGQKTPDNDFSYIDVGSVDNINGKLSANENVIEKGNAPSRARKIVKNGCIIYSTIRPYLLNICIVDKDFRLEPIASTAFAVLNPFKGIYNKYLFYYLRSTTFIDYVNGTMKGVAYPAINDENLLLGLVPLPPLSEQKLIVEKVEEVLSYCDKLK